MHGGVILYTGNYGSTEQYARWISQGTAYRCLDLKKQPNPDLSPYRVVILGSPIRQGQLLLGPWCRTHQAVLASKKVIIYTVSATPAGDPLLAERVAESVGSKLFEQMTWFALPGRLIQAELNLKDRLALYIHDILGGQFVRKYLQRDFNHVTQKNLEPLFEFLWDWYHREHRPLYQSGKLRPPQTGHLD